MKNPLIKTPNKEISYEEVTDDEFLSILRKEIKKMPVGHKLGFDFGTKKRFQVIREI